MKRNIITFIIIISSVCLISQTQNISSQIDIDEIITNYMNSIHKAGLSACIIKGDSIIWRGNYGYANVAEEIPVTGNSLFYAYSIGKSITAASLMKLWESGLLELDENINGFLPFQVDNPNFTYDSITPRMLMSHTASLVDYDINALVTIGDPTISLAYFVENYYSSSGEYYSPNNFSSYTPGTHYEYSNFGSGLNGYLAEALLGQPFKDYAKDSIFTPLEMYNSAWFLDEIELDDLALGYQYTGGQYVPYPNYAHPAYPGLTLKSSSEELAHYVVMLMNEGNYKNEQILDGSTVDTMRTIQMGLTNGMGLGLYQSNIQCPNEDKIIWSHKGGGTTGYASEIQFCPDENIGIVYMSNSENFALLVVQKLFEYGALIIIPDIASDTTDVSFTANWQYAPDAVNYYLDVSTDWQFSNFVEGYENLDVGQVTSFPVSGLESNTNYFYRLRAFNGVDTGPTSGSVHTKTLLPTSFNEINSSNITSLNILSNPVNDKLSVEWTLKKDCEVKISLINIAGKTIHTFLTENMKKGQHKEVFEIYNISPGIYIISLQAGNTTTTKKLLKQ